MMPDTPKPKPFRDNVLTHARECMAGVQRMRSVHLTQYVTNEWKAGRGVLATLLPPTSSEVAEIHLAIMRAYDAGVQDALDAYRAPLRDDEDGATVIEARMRALLMFGIERTYTVRENTDAEIEAAVEELDAENKRRAAEKKANRTLAVARLAKEAKTAKARKRR